MCQITSEMLIDQIMYFINKSKTDTKLIESVYSFFPDFDAFRNIKNDKINVIAKRFGKRCKLFGNLIKFVKKNCHNQNEAYLKLDMIEFIQRLGNLIKNTEIIYKSFELADRFNTIIDFLNNYKKTFLIKGNVDAPTNIYELIFSNPKPTHFNTWVRLILWEYLEGLFTEIKALSFVELNVNPYTSLILDFNLEESTELSFYQLITRKIAGKWGNTGEDILRHNFLVRSQLREFDLKRWDEKIYWHYEIKATPDKTMRGAELKKFLEKIIPDYQQKYPNYAFRLGGLYRGEKSNLFDSKISKIIEDHPNINFLALNRWIIGGDELWKEITKLENPLEILFSQFKIIADCFKIASRNLDFNQFILRKLEDIVKSLKITDLEDYFYKGIG